MDAGEVKVKTCVEKVFPIAKGSTL